MEPTTPHSVAVGDEDADGWLSRALACLGSGGIVALPTETFYALATDAASTPSVRAVLSLKGYADMRPVLLLAGSAGQVEQLCPWSHIAGAADLAAAFWPGALTLILPLGPGRTLAACPGGTAAIRVPAHPVPRRLAQAMGGFLTGTSANRVGKPPARSAPEVERSFPRGLQLILDGGPTAGQEPSTLVDLSSAAPRLVRAGAVPREEVASILGCRLSSPTGAAE
jgi:L-threonylcarbamoyladenylate synthase